MNNNIVNKYFSELANRQESDFKLRAMKSGKTILFFMYYILLIPIYLTF